MVQLSTVFLKNSQLLAHPPNTVQVIKKWAELIPDLPRNLIDLFFTVFPDPITNSDNLVSLEFGFFFFFFFFGGGGGGAILKKFTPAPPPPPPPHSLNTAHLYILTVDICVQ